MRLVRMQLGSEHRWTVLARFGVALALGALMAVGVISYRADAETGSAQFAPFFPLQRGTWTFRDAASGAQSAMVVRDSLEGVALVTGIPALGDQLLTWSGDTLLAWDLADSRWEPLFRFGAEAGTAYPVSLSSSERFRDARLTVVEKGASVAVPALGGQRVDGVRFAVQSAGGALPIEMVFAQGSGLVQVVADAGSAPLGQQLVQVAADEPAGSAFQLSLKLTPERDGEFTLDAVTLTPDACHSAGPVRRGAAAGGGRGVVAVEPVILEIVVREGRCAQMITPVRHRVPNLQLAGGGAAGRGTSVMVFAAIGDRVVASASISPSSASAR